MMKYTKDFLLKKEYYDYYIVWSGLIIECDLPASSGFSWHYFLLFNFPHFDAESNEKHTLVLVKDIWLKEAQRCLHFSSQEQMQNFFIDRFLIIYSPFWSFLRSTDIWWD